MKIDLGIKKIGGDSPVFIIAEMSGNHNKSFDRALRIIDLAAEEGADAIKLQTYTPDTITINSDKDYFKVKINNKWSGRILYDLYEEAYTPWEWHEELKKYAESKGLIFFSTPFDVTAVDFLEKLNVGIYKVASFELVDIPLLERVGKTKKPVIISRGMATLDELEFAISTLKKTGTKDIVVLHCLSSYPVEPENMNLITIKDIKDKFGVISGLSDHSRSHLAAMIATSLGASVIEKHLTLERENEGVDSFFSLQKGEFREFVSSVRRVESSLGVPYYGTTQSEKENYLYRKSLFVTEDIRKGEKLIYGKNFRSIRPGYGLAPKYYNEINGKISKNEIKKGTPLDWHMMKE